MGLLRSKNRGDNRPHREKHLNLERNLGLLEEVGATKQREK